MKRQARAVLPVVATLAAMMVTVAALVRPESVILYAVLPAVALVAVMLFVDKAPLAVSMGVLLLMLAGVAWLGQVAPITSDGEEAIPEFPAAMQEPFGIGVGILGMVLALVARWRVVRPTWVLYAALALAWLAFAGLFFVAPREFGTGTWQTALVALAAAGLAGLGLVWARRTAVPPSA